MADKIIKIFYKLFSRIKKRIFSLKQLISEFSSSTISTNVVEDNLITKEIANNGFYQYKELIDNNLLNELKKDFNKVMSNGDYTNEGQLKGRIHANGTLTKTLEKLGLKYINDAKKFFNAETKIELTYYQISEPTNLIDNVPGGNFHVDDNKPNIKLFVYLTDVNENNGPFCVVPNTGSWKLKGSKLRAIFWEIFHIRFFLYNFLVDYSKYESKKKLFTGISGTHFLVDTTCLHKDTPVIEGLRHVAVVSFNKK